MALYILKLIFGLFLLQSCIFAHADDSQFEIRVGDTISIKVYNEPDLTVKAKVGNTGVLKIPLIGDIKVINLIMADLKFRFSIDRGGTLTDIY